jgi:RNA polymerase sigma factor (sigma-70 family)
MRPDHDPRPAARLIAHYPRALAAVRRYYPGLSDDDHEDVVQEAMARVLQRLRRGPLEDPLPYLLRVIYTTGAAVLQDRHRSTISLDDHDDQLDGVEIHADRSSLPLSPEEEVLFRAERETVWRVLRQDLSAEERWTLALRLGEEWSPAEISAELGISRHRYRELHADAGRKLDAGLARARDAERRTYTAALRPAA